MQPKTKQNDLYAIMKNSTAQLLPGNLSKRTENILAQLEKPNQINLNQL